jgi:SAM-dependent methyltransferase
VTLALAPLDVLAPGRSGSWAHDGVVVVRAPGAGLRATRGARLVVTHDLTADELDESLVARVGGLVRGAREFELVLTGLVRSTVDDPLQAWTTYYRNSLAALGDGSAAFAPVHDRAAGLVRGASVLDLGSCFGFFPLRLAAAGLTVTASDLCAGTVRLLAAVAPQLGVELGTLVCDAAAVPRPDGCADTVTVLHVLEHLDPEHGEAVLAEAVRLARRRVVVAVPLEDTATTCHGHVRTFTLDGLAALADALPGRTRVSEHHGGWLVLDVG